MSAIVKPIIFLDFDGPLFPDEIFKLEPNMGQAAKDKCLELELHPYISYWFGSPTMVAWLNAMGQRYPYDLVISSSWADDWLHEKKHIAALLKANSIIYTMHDNWRTPRGEEYACRAAEICAWLKANPGLGEHYIILDDLSSGPELGLTSTYEERILLQKNVFLASMKTGFSAQDYENIEQRLSQIYSEINLQKSAGFKINS